MLTALLYLGLYAVTASVLLLLFVFCLEVLVAVLPWKETTQVQPLSRLRFAVLIPAHNEQAILSRTLKTLVPTLGPKDWVLVVADHCTDNTASLARHAGAEVVELSDPAKRGKCHALDAGLKHLQPDPPDAVVFLDANCQVQPETVRMLGTAAVTMRRPAQAMNLCESEPHQDQLQAVTDFGFRFNNVVRALGLFRMTGLCYLTGTGTALPWALTYNLRAAGDDQVEDAQLGLDLAVNGNSPLLVPGAQVESPLSKRMEVIQRPRAAEKHGYLLTLLTQVPRLLYQGATQGRPEVIGLALDLAIPPLSVLAGLWMVTFTAAFLSVPLGASAWPVLLLVLGACGVVLSVAAGWLFHCRHTVRFATLCAAPFYTLSLLHLPGKPQRWLEERAAVVAKYTGGAS